MGFYHPATLVKDSQRHGVRVLPIDVGSSDWACTWEDADVRTSVAGACRLGLRYVKGLRKEAGETIALERRQEAFGDVDEMVKRCQLREEELTVLAEVGALASLGLSRRQALWQVARASKPAGPLLEADRGAKALPTGEHPLPEMSAIEETLADFAGSDMTVGPQAMEHIRGFLDNWGIVKAADLLSQPHGKLLRTAGSVIVRQRPGTAKGLLFLTLEDETGMSQAIVSPDLLQQHRRLIVGTPNLIVEGEVQKKDGTVSLRAERFWPLQDLTRVPSHDFH